MRIPTRTLRAVLGALAAMLALSSQNVIAQSYPAKPIKLIVPFPAGGSTDLVARAVGQKLAESLGQPVVVENRPGAGGSIGTEVVAKSAPDGYTLLMGGVQNAIIAAFYPKLNYDPLADFAPVAMIADIPNVLVVNATTPYRTVSELVAAAKAKPGTLNYASAGAGTASHLVCELFKSRVAAEIVHVPYKGNAPAVNDVLGGQVPVMCNNLSGTLPYLKGDKLRMLAVTGTARSPSAPDVPTFKEAGIAGMESGAWMGLLAPAATPRPIVDRLAAETAKALRATDVRERLAALGAAPMTGTPEAFAERLREERAMWGEVVRVSGAKPE